MSYINLETFKKINGIPVDLNYFSKIAENDAFLKSATDDDENLDAVSKSIIPAIDNLYNLGSSSFKIAAGFFNIVNSNSISLLSGSLNNTSLKIGNAGFSSLGNGEISFIGNTNLESFRFMPSGVLIKAANNFQLKLENTNISSPSKWSIGTDVEGLRITDETAAPLLKMLFGPEEVSFYNPILGSQGTDFDPTYSFGEDSTTGFYKDPSGAILNFVVSSVKKLTLSEEEFKVSTDNSILESVQVNKTLKLNAITLDTPGLDQQIDVSSISKIMIDAGIGDIEISQLIGGQEGQMLYIYKKNPTNTFTLVNLNPSATEAISLKGNLNYVSTNDMGGIVLSFDEGTWREISRS